MCYTSQVWQLDPEHPENGWYPTNRTAADFACASIVALEWCMRNWLRSTSFQDATQEIKAALKDSIVFDDKPASRNDFAAESFAASWDE
jgi:hypothetical protein